MFSLHLLRKNFMRKLVFRDEETGEFLSRATVNRMRGQGVEVHGEYVFIDTEESPVINSIEDIFDYEENYDYEDFVEYEFHATGDTGKAE